MKNVKKVLLLTLVLIVISFSIILLFGRTYTCSFNINSDDYTYSIDRVDGDIDIIDEKIIDNKYIIKIKGKSAAKVFIEFNNGDYSEQAFLYIHKSMVITNNNYFGYSNGSLIIPISLSIFLIYILYLLFKKYKECINDNLYQYKNVAYLGIIIFIISFTLFNILSIFNYQGLYDTINKTISSFTSFSMLLFPITFITFILVTISNIILIRREGKSFKNLLGLFLGLFICILVLLPDFVYGILMKTQIVDIYNLNSLGPYVYNFLESVVYLIAVYLECVLIGTIIIALKAVKRKVSYDKDYIIILGCKIKKDGTLPPLLRGRVDRAIQFRNEQLESTGKDLIFIPSGGKGSDEVISEALAMKNYLIDKGINKNNILIEDKSTNTYENIKYSYKLINKKNSNIVISTTNYHVFRAGLLASQQGIIVDGIGSKTKTYYWINAFIREFIGTLYSERKKHFIVFSIIIITIIFMIAVIFITNNI